jgi:antirestriction protein ArdC
MNHDLYQAVTDRIVAALEAGVPPWARPWTTESEPMPLNAASRRPYRGINAVLLTLASQLRGYSRNAWLTYRQASELNAQVRGGERGTQVVFYKLDHAKEMVEAAEEQRSPRVIPLLRSFVVFNVAQIDNLPERLNPPPRPATWSPCSEAERVFQNSGAVIQHGGSMAFYSPLDDRIQLPPKGAFSEPESYYATGLHELVHWSGHPDRLNRVLSRRFGDEAYAMEELVAELGGAFLCAHCRLNGRLQHANYLASWLKILKADKRAIFSVASKAQQAADFVLSVKPTDAAASQPIEEAA